MFNSMVELLIPIEMPVKEAKAECQTYPVKTEGKIS